MSGAVLDGVRTHHSGVDPDEPAAATLARLVGKLVAGPPTTTALQHLHDIAADQDPLPIADAVTSELTGRDLSTDRLRQIGRWLAEYGTRRNAVALGVLLLGLAGDHRDRDLLLLLGSLEDLSLYAAVALTRSQPDRDRALFDLARRVAGWGRIQTVRRLAGSQDPEIKAWLVRHGFRNQIMDEYLAHTAATTGDLYAALTTPPVDDELLDGAGDILTALCLGGPANVRSAEKASGSAPTPGPPSEISGVRDLLGRAPQRLPGNPRPAKAKPHTAPTRALAGRRTPGQGPACPTEEIPPIVQHGQTSQTKRSA